MANMPDTPPTMPPAALRRVERQQVEVELLAARAPRPRTARHIAGALGVAVRTVERDLAALRRTGLPLAVRRGPGGGHYLPLRRDTVLDLRLDVSEIAAVVAALAAIDPWSGAASSRLTTKLTTALHRLVDGTPPDDVTPRGPHN